MADADTPRSLRVYISGASAELERAELAHAALGLIEGVCVVSTWTRHVREHVAMGRPDHELSSEARLTYASRDLEEVDQSTLVWGLVPPPGVDSTGLWWELSRAHAKGTRVLASGDVRRSLFLACVMTAESDGLALAQIARWAKGGAGV